MDFNKNKVDIYKEGQMLTFIFYSETNYFELEVLRL